VITKFGTDKGIDLTLPPEGSIKEIPKNNIMSITMDDAGAVVLDGKAVILGQVQSLVKTIAEANDRLVITVKTTRKTPYRNFIAVMDQLKEAGVRKISVLEPDR
ncbi:MAG TPA: biopolymer transporter ExbD, partial [bacterium]|nr:biopolymer transporter ExbD [bacterium]